MIRCESNIDKCRLRSTLPVVNAAFSASEWRAADNYSRDGGKQIVVTRRLRRATDESGQEHSGGREAHRRRDVSTNLVLQDPHPSGFRCARIDTYSDKPASDRGLAGNEPRRYHEGEGEQYIGGQTNELGV